MKKMPHSQLPLDDLDYLAQLGFEQVPVTSADLEELSRKVKARSFSYNRGSYFAVICLLAGAFLGVSLFFVLVETPPERMEAPAAPVMAEVPAPAIPGPVPATVLLDTVVVERENFVSRITKPAGEAAGAPAPVENDSAVTLVSRQTDLSALLQSPLREEKLKFILNAPVVYIHDLKVTDYQRLYFKKNRFVNVSGTSATLAAKENPALNVPQLRQSAEVYLHEELANALLDFKKGRYDRCMYELTLIASYNPEDVNCDFYLGMCCYYRKNYGKAVQLLDKCTGSLNNAFLQEAMYYKALSIYESGQKPEAARLLKQIAAENEFYSAKASSYLKSLE